MEKYRRMERIVLLAMGFSCLLNSPAVAVNVAYVADSIQPSMKSGQVIVGSVTWLCQGSICKALGQATAPNVVLCRSLATQVGSLRSFAIGTQNLDSASLMQCNAGLAPVAKPGLPKQSASPQVGLSAKLPTTSTSGPGTKVVPYKPKEPPEKPADSSSAPAVPAAARFTPRRITTSSITVIGTGAALTPPVFVGRRIRTPEITVVGTGVPLTPPSFLPRTVRTGQINAQGTGTLP